MKRFAALLIVLFASLWIDAAEAQVDHFLKIGDLRGESTQIDHAGWIDVDSFSWGLSNPAPPVGGAVGRATFSDFSWDQALDTSTVPLFVAVASGQLFPQATFDVVSSAGAVPQTFFQMVFDNAQATSLRLSGYGFDQRIFVSGSLAGSRITMRYWPTDPLTGALGAVIEGSWDLASASAPLFSGDPQVLEGLMLAAAGAEARPAADSVGVVPEPSTAMLLLGGLLLLGVLTQQQQRRRR
ncbi:Hcp family type VI secretion system effector [Rivibacter subsaxonicus]|uniref:Putative secreted protein with PEP-CTERM sorting signal n=1 Tax=Rivibacter subsaxonicus TaxID=457575 RepID=A0A4Q7VZ91_9BURK|nr:type VI secretion system tube protein Hcp [Rivibacter subsaxonicus]RZU02192.1 putative secreted protein with PEP-CTERM sorting signal [Rivibacter subsaxonicus]